MLEPRVTIQNHAHPGWGAIDGRISYGRLGSIIVYYNIPISASSCSINQLVETAIHVGLCLRMCWTHDHRRLEATNFIWKSEWYCKRDPGILQCVLLLQNWSWHEYKLSILKYCPCTVDNIKKKSCLSLSWEGLAWTMAVFRQLSWPSIWCSRLYAVHWL